MNRFELRLDKARRKMNENELLFIESDTDIRYLTGFTGDSSWLLLSHKRAVFITDGRYTEQINREAQIPLEIETTSIKRKVFDIIEEIVRDENPSVFYADKSDMRLTFYEKIMPVLAMSGLTIKDNSLIKKLRIRKDEYEVEIIRRNLMLTELGYAYIQPIIKTGMTELEVAAELEFYMKKQGAEAMSFETIVASGNRSALPHGVASDKIISDNEIVLFDFGIIKDGYCSDFTRCFHHGGRIHPKLKEIQKVVYEANQSAEEKAAPGVKASDLHKAAYSVIEKAGYAEYFTHSTGHGVGMQIHEEPRISENSDTILKPGMVFTVEPGIYLPEIGGVRLEDMVVIHSNGCEVLTTTNYQL